MQYLFFTSQTLHVTQTLALKHAYLEHRHPRGKTSTWMSCLWTSCLDGRSYKYSLGTLTVAALSLSTNTNNSSQHSYVTNCYFEFIECNTHLAQLLIVYDLNIIRNVQNTFLQAKCATGLQHTGNFCRVYFSDISAWV